MRYVSRLLGTLLASLFVTISPLHAQQDEIAVVRVTTRLVSLEVLVTDKRSKLRVDDLQLEDFEVTDNKRPVKLTYFSRSSTRERPLALALLIGVTKTNEAVVSRLRDGLGRALKRLPREDQVSVLAVATRDFKLVQELTSDRERVLAALAVERLQFKRQDVSNGEEQKEAYKKFEALPAAVNAVLRHMQERQPQATHALVVIDPDFSVVSGRVVNETAEGLLAKGAVLSGLIKADLKVKAIKVMVRGMTAPSGGQVKTDSIAYLARQTGGEVIEVNDRDYSDALEQIIGNLAGRYSLGFVPDEKDLDGQFHKLKVKIKDSVMKKRKLKLKLRARSGYYAKREDVSP
jgi:VWFA-related protein